MKFMLVIVIILAVLAVIGVLNTQQGGIIGLFDQEDENSALMNMLACQNDSDCTIALGRECCECPQAMNKKYQRIHNSQPIDACEEAAQCPSCNPAPVRAVCQNNVCVGI